jgi:broad specificity phosphatase PhoE
MTLRLIFIRHGLSSFNKEGRIQGRNDLSTLSKEGQLQAEAAGKTISSIPIDAIYSIINTNNYKSFACASYSPGLAKFYSI